MARVSFDIDALTRDFTALEKRQVPFALALTLNATALDAQDAARVRMYARLTVRQASTRSLFERAIVFNRDGRADSRTGKLSAEVRIVGQPGFAGTSAVMARIGAILIRQEIGGVRDGTAMVRRGQQFQLAGNLIPFEGLRTASRSVPRQVYPVNIGLSPKSAIAGGEEFASSYRGGKKKRGTGFKKGTKFYFATEKAIFVREQLGKRSEVDALWWFQKRITLEPRLGFGSTFERVSAQRMPLNWVRSLDRALSTAR